MLNNKGFSLIEILISIVVFSIAIVAVLVPLNLVSQKSGDAAIYSQEIAIADGMVQEIIEKNLYMGSYSGTDRSLFDSISNYQNYHSSGVYSETGTKVSGLDAYSVDVSITDAIVPNVLSGQAKDIGVTVANGSIKYVEHFVWINYE